MTGRYEGDRDIAERDPLAIAGRLQGAAGQFAVSRPHDRDRLRRREYRVIAGPGMVAMTVRDHRPRHRPCRIDIEVAGLAIEAGRGHPEPAFRPWHNIGHGSDIGAGLGNVSFAQPSTAEIGRATLSSGCRSALTPISSSTTAAAIINPAPSR